MKTVEEVLTCSSRFVKSTDVEASAEKSLIISGIASLSTEDRDGHVIDPTLFDIATFMKNPQLWYNHALWRRPDGNEIAIGRVVDIAPIRVSASENSPMLSLYRLDTGEQFRMINKADFALAGGELGLWVTCEVLEPDVITMVEDGRLNAFSWQGVGHRRADGKMISIDLFEISLVNLPANQHAVFQIGKSLRVVDNAGNSRCVDDYTTLVSTTEVLAQSMQPGSVLTLQQMRVLTKALQDVAIANAVVSAVEKTEEGGEDMSKELIAALGDIQKKLEGLDTLAAGVTSIADRVAALEKSAVATDPEDATQAATQDPAPAATAENADEQQADIAKALDGITAKLAGISDLSTSIKSLEDRIARIEKTPASSRNVSDAEADTDALKKSVLTALKDATPDERKKLATQVQNMKFMERLIPAGVVNANART